MRIGVMTGGGDSSGINAVLRTLVTQADRNGDEVYGILRGWEGLLLGNLKRLTLENTAQIMYAGGTMIGSSRTNLFKVENGFDTALGVADKFNLDAIIAIGGDDTLGVADHFCSLGLKAVGLPQTIDNDVGGTDYCIGFDTAVTRIVEDIHSLKTSCASHGQDVVVETMGRETGWLAAVSGLITEAEAIVIPEMSISFDAVVAKIDDAHQKGNNGCVIVVAEGCELEGCERIEQVVDAFGHKKLAGIGYGLRDQLQRALGSTIRCHIMGYVARGGDATAYEVTRSVEFGREAYRMVKAGGFGKLIGYRNGRTMDTDLEEVRVKRFVTAELTERIAELY